MGLNERLLGLPQVHKLYEFFRKANINSLAGRHDKIVMNCLQSQ
jgi:hypothetical protein